MPIWKATPCRVFETTLLVYMNELTTVPASVSRKRVLWKTVEITLLLVAVGRAIRAPAMVRLGLMAMAILHEPEDPYAAAIAQETRAAAQLDPRKGRSPAKRSYASYAAEWNPREKRNRTTSTPSKDAYLDTSNNVTMVLVDLHGERNGRPITRLLAGPPPLLVKGYVANGIADEMTGEIEKAMGMKRASIGSVGLWSPANLSDRDGLMWANRTHKRMAITVHADVPRTMLEVKGPSNGRSLALTSPKPLRLRCA